LAFIGRFHESENLNRFVWTHGRHSGLKEFNDFDHQRLVTFKCASRYLPFLAACQAVKTLVFAENAPTSAAPESAHFNLSVRCRPPLDRLAVATKDRVECFDSMHPVPEHIGM